MTVERRLADLGREWSLDRRALAALAALLDVVASDPAAPTTVTDPRRAVDVHIADSLSALRFPALRAAGRIADLGSGAGFPGLALAAALPQSQVVVVESQRRKCAFLESAVAAAELENVSVRATRIESWREGIGWADAVTARALAPQAVVLEYAAPLLALGGTLVDWRGRIEGDEAERSRRAAADLGLELSEQVNGEPWPDARDHVLVCFRKVAETPGRFPRRDGVARKRPLGGVPGPR